MEEAETGEMIYVYGRGEQRIGTAGAASEGGVAGADLDLRPLSRPGELLEATPGLIATQHSGGGKANQFFLRGFNLDHGTDYSVYLDDMPINFRTHGHGQGYLDVNGLIPETVARVDYRKGPYRVDAGDFSFVGSCAITTHDRMEPFASVEAGSFGYCRVVAGGSVAAGGRRSAAGRAGQVRTMGRGNCPRISTGYSALAKFSRPLGDGDFSARLQLLQTPAGRRPNNCPNALIGTPLCADRYCSLDLTLRGTHRAADPHRRLRTATTGA